MTAILVSFERPGIKKTTKLYLVYITIPNYNCVTRNYTPVHLVESVENYAHCMRRCLLCSSNTSVSIAHLLLCARIVLTPALSIKLCAIKLLSLPLGRGDNLQLFISPLLKYEG